MKPFKHPNGRIVARRSNGTFRNFTMREILGNEANEHSHKLICGLCGYGQDEPWIPLMLSAYCPKCKNQENHKIREFMHSQKSIAIKGKIQFYKELIGIDFINPLAFREYGGKLSSLERRLENQLRLDEKKSFGMPSFENAKFKEGDICTKLPYGGQVIIRDKLRLERIDGEWVFQYMVCRLNKKMKPEKYGNFYALETELKQYQS